MCKFNACRFANEWIRTPGNTRNICLTCRRPETGLELAKRRGEKIGEMERELVKSLPRARSTFSKSGTLQYRERELGTRLTLEKGV